MATESNLARMKMHLKKKTIALAIENFSRFGGGAESYAVALAQTLMNDGWEVHCYGQRWDNEPAGAVFHAINVPVWLPTWAKMLYFALAHARLVKKQHYDVVLGFGNTLVMNAYQSHGGVHWYSTFRKVYSEPNGFLRMLKRLLVVLSPKHHVRHWLESAPFRKKDLPRVIAISDMIKEDMMRCYGVRPDRIDLVYNGIDIERFSREESSRCRGPVRQRLGIGMDEVVFVFVSYELKKKGIEPLVMACNLLKQRGCGTFRLLVVGGKGYPGLHRMIRQEGLGETVLFSGPSKNVPEMYGASDVFVLPSYYDACSLSVLEAMACGLPVITTETNGISGILRYGGSG
ncbi:MAG TPA: glycosyltransferase family 4 protein, partial [Deltaproteobacteria bacterium]|nr:glycosyltransferase family 4 protein [Deltaproteobacteria bacterium]